ncbi:hypothetical protein HKD37_19G054443 [Glycine soja]
MPQSEEPPQQESFFSIWLRLKVRRFGGTVASCCRLRLIPATLAIAQKKKKRNGYPQNGQSSELLLFAAAVFCSLLERDAPSPVKSG